VGKEPDQVRADVERTRARLGTDVDALSEKVSPGAVAHRRIDDVKGAAVSVRDKVMGSGHGAHERGSQVAEHVSGGMSAAGDKVGDAASSARDAARGAPRAARRQTQGNPLAAGVIAFGAGWLAASLLPTSDAEKQAASALQDRADTVVEPVRQAAGDAAAELRDALEPRAREAATEVKDTAQQGAAEVRGTAGDAAQDVRGTAEDAAGTVRDQARSSAGTVGNSARGS
jgi:hypothetical protein